MPRIRERSCRGRPRRKGAERPQVAGVRAMVLRPGCRECGALLHLVGEAARSSVTAPASTTTSGRSRMIASARLSGASPVTRRSPAGGRSGPAEGARMGGRSSRSAYRARRRRSARRTLGPAGIAGGSGRGARRAGGASMKSPARAGAAPIPARPDSIRAASRRGDRSKRHRRPQHSTGDLPRTITGLAKGYRRIAAGDNRRQSPHFADAGRRGRRVTVGAFATIPAGKINGRRGRPGPRPRHGSRPAMSARASPPPFFLDVKIPDGAAARCSA